MAVNYLKRNLFSGLSFLWLISFILILTACSSVPEKPLLADEEFSCVKDLHVGSPIQQLESTAKKSNFLQLHENKKAFQWRLALIDQAQRSLDIQTFIWETDETGGLLIDRIIKAANRGVHVRLLVDDFLLAGRDSIGALLNNHPNIELRVFNPLQVREDRMVFRGLEMLFNLSILNHRMHNKLFISDNTAGIIGGRNIGNEYFGMGNKLNYRDYDLVVRGPIVSEITDSFNVFWNSPSSLPLEMVVSANVLNEINSEETQKNARQQLNKIISESTLDKEFDLKVKDWKMMFEASREEVFSGYSRVIYDCPPSVNDPEPGQVAELLRKLAMSVEKEIFFITPYLIPSDEFRNGLRTLIERGVQVRILTNSLESSDSAAAVSGYAGYRKELVEMGVDLYEIRADAAKTHLFKTESSDAEFLSLHAKVIIFDRNAVYVGSLNLDPRSIVWNTEIGALIESPELAGAIISDFEQDLLPENSWSILLDEDGDIFWQSEKEVKTSTPARGFWQRISIFFYSLLPIENQL